MGQVVLPLGATGIFIRCGIVGQPRVKSVPSTVGGAKLGWRACNWMISFTKSMQDRSGT